MSGRVQRAPQPSSDRELRCVERGMLTRDEFAARGGHGFVTARSRLPMAGEGSGNL